MECASLTVDELLAHSNTFMDDAAMIETITYTDVTVTNSNITSNEHPILLTSAYTIYSLFRLSAVDQNYNATHLFDESSITTSDLINFMTTFTPGRFQSYLFRYFSIACIKMKISHFIFKYDH